ncbi:hypothetical protein VZT92_007139 [Zoarces viviparus]|uniref:Uncharacterized protein n=1 Tax=Zoarces viviparus TaxID=48416 RepID=A0AAW1FJ45_ZOAVI
MTGACSASEASVQHLWTEQHPTCYQTSAVYFSTGAPRPPLQPLPQVSQVHEKATSKLFSPSTSSSTLKSSSASLGLICYLGHPLTLALLGLPP